MSHHYSTVDEVSIARHVLRFAIAFLNIKLPSCCRNTSPIFKYLPCSKFTRARSSPNMSIAAISEPNHIFQLEHSSKAAFYVRPCISSVKCSGELQSLVSLFTVKTHHNMYTDLTILTPRVQLVRNNFYSNSFLPRAATLSYIHPR